MTEHKITKSEAVAGFARFVDAMEAWRGALSGARTVAQAIAEGSIVASDLVSTDKGRSKANVSKCHAAGRGFLKFPESQWHQEDVEAMLRVSRTSGAGAAIDKAIADKRTKTPTALVTYAASLLVKASEPSKREARPATGEDGAEVEPETTGDPIDNGLTAAFAGLSGLVKALRAGSPTPEQVAEAERFVKMVNGPRGLAKMVGTFSANVAANNGGGRAPAETVVETAA